MSVLHLSDAGAELQGSLGQEGRPAQAEPPRHQPQEEFLPNSPGKSQIRLLPHG